MQPTYTPSRVTARAESDASDMGPVCEPKTLEGASEGEGQVVYWPWNQLEEAEHYFVIQAACECQRVLDKKEKNRTELIRNRFGLTVAGAVLSGVGTILATSLGVASSETTGSTQDVVVGLTIGSGVIGAAGTAMATIGGAMPTQSSVDAETRAAWRHWEGGMIEINRWRLATEEQARSAHLERASAEFIQCSSAAGSLGVEEDTVTVSPRQEAEVSDAVESPVEGPQRAEDDPGAEATTDEDKPEVQP